MTDLKLMLMSGGLLRIGKPYGAHIAKCGRDQFGRYVFALCK